MVFHMCLANAVKKKIKKSKIKVIHSPFKNLNSKIFNILFELSHFNISGTSNLYMANLQWWPSKMIVFTHIYLLQPKFTKSPSKYFLSYLFKYL